MIRRSIPNLRRTTGKKSAKKKFILYCEGENTEPKYFAALAREWCGALIAVETIPAVGVPRTIADRATDRQRALKRNRRKTPDSFELEDEVWAVFDRDEHANFDEAVTKCMDNGVGVARSNPCFELWLILHVEDFQRSDGRHAVQEYLKKICPEYDPRREKTINCTRILCNLEHAEKLAERQLSMREEEGNSFGAPSTTVFELTKRIRFASQRTIGPRKSTTK